MNLQRRRRRVYCSLSIPEVKQACQLIRGVLRAQIRNGPAPGGCDAHDVIRRGLLVRQPLLRFEDWSQP